MSQNRCGIGFVLAVAVALLAAFVFVGCSGFDGSYPQYGIGQSIVPHGSGDSNEALEARRDLRRRVRDAQTACGQMIWGGWTAVRSCGLSNGAVRRELEREWTGMGSAGCARSGRWANRVLSRLRGR